MRLSNEAVFALCIAFMVNLGGCGSPSPGNAAPIARAGADQSVAIGTTVALDGSGSSDPDGDPFTYAWTLTAKPDGSASTLVGAASARPAITPDIAGSYVASLTVDDGQAISDPAIVTITAEQVDYSLVGGADGAVFLGCLTCDPVDVESVCHPFGTYGQPSSASSIWNPSGTFGSQVSSYSPWNPSGTIVPFIVRSDGAFSGYFTVNALQFNRTNVPALLGILDFFSSTLDLAETRAFACAD